MELETFPVCVLLMITVSYLFVHEDVYNWVDDGAALGK